MPGRLHAALRKAHVVLHSTLTRMPAKHPISGEHAMLFIGSTRERLS